jgi:hypothetical protein
MLGVAREPVDLGAGRGPRPDPVCAEPRARRVGTQPARKPQHEPGRLPAELVALGFLGDAGLPDRDRSSGRRVHTPLLTAAARNGYPPHWLRPLCPTTVPRFVV